MTQDNNALAQELEADLCKDGSSRAKRSAAHTRHGHTKGHKYSPTYSSWQAMLSRCRYEARDTENKHAGRGIRVCDRWQSFENFHADMGDRPEGTTLDRMDNNSDYYLENCRWATPTEQARNRRNARLTLATATEVALLRLRGETCKSIAASFGISENLPREIVKGRTWPDALARAKEIFDAG